LRGALLREILITLVIAIVVYVGISYSLQNAEVLGQSMEPNLHHGERVFINKLAYKFSEPKRGDIIVFVPPEELASPNDYVKRIIGLPGERVEIRNGHVYIHKTDGSVVILDESEYVVDPIIGYYMSDVIPDDHYFVMGDNRNNSGDSRGGWTVAKSDIVGRAWIVIWPPSEWGVAPNYNIAAVMWPCPSLRLKTWNRFFAGARRCWTAISCLPPPALPVYWEKFRILEQPEFTSSCVP
jgi:signal peptidase I